MKHGLGFEHVPLGRLGSWRVIVHWWPTTGASEDIHNHRWDFISVMLWGALTEEIYDVTLGTSMDLYRCLRGQHRTEATPTAGTGDVRLARRRVRRAPTVYTGRAGEFHRVSVHRAPALTVFIKRRPHEDIQGLAARRKPGGASSTGSIKPR